MDDIFKRTRMVNKGKKFGSTGHFFSRQRQYTFFIFDHILPNAWGGGSKKNRSNGYPRPIAPLSKKFGCDITFSFTALLPNSDSELSGKIA
jgi:hypothetical protein